MYKTKTLKLEFSPYEMLYALFFMIAFFSFCLMPSTAFSATIGRPMSNAGLVGYWPFEDSAGSLTTNDKSGRGYNGTLTNGPVSTTSTSGLGQALYFDGSDDYVDMGDMSSLIGSNTEGTVSLWYANNNDISTSLFYYGDSGTDFNSLKLSFLTDNTFRVVLKGAVGNVYRGDVDLGAGSDNNTWHHIVFTVNSSGNRFYYDGVQQTLTYTTGSAASTEWFDDLVTEDKLTVGSDRDSNPVNYLTGKLDDVRVYNRALSAEEVKRLYNIKTPRVSGGVDNTGLVGYWKFEEGTGTIAGDSSGNKRSGNLTNMESSDWVIGKSGLGLDFDGSNEMVGMGNVLDFERTSPFTMSAWVKLPSASPSTADQVVSKADASAIGYSFVIRGDVANDPVEIELRGSGQWLTMQSDQVWTTGWTHLVWTYDGSNTPGGMKLYRDGVSQSLTTVSNNLASNITNTGNFNIGAFRDTLNPFLGKIDEVRIYNRTLSSTEVKNLYTGSKATVVNKTNTNKLTNGLVAYWTFDGKNIYSDKAFDISGSNYTGTLTNGPKAAIGKLGQSLQFNGVNSYVQMGDINQLDNVTAFSISGWFRRRLVNSRVFLGSKATDNTHVVAIEVGQDGLVYTLVRNGVANFFTFANNDTNWHHVVMIYDGTQPTDATKLVAYLDGVKQTLDENNGPIPSSTADHSNSFSLGDSRFGLHTSDTDGYIDDYRIYNRALSADEVKALYNMR